MPNADSSRSLNRRGVPGYQGGVPGDIGGAREGGRGTRKGEAPAGREMDGECPSQPVSLRHGHGVPANAAVSMSLTMLAH